MPDGNLYDNQDANILADDTKRLDREVSITQTVANGAGLTPEREGKIADDSRRFNIAPDVLRNLTPENYRQATTPPPNLQTLTPATAAFLKSTPQRATIVRDDLRSLMKVEGLQRAYRQALKEDEKIQPVSLGDAWQQGLDTVNLGKAYYRTFIRNQPQEGDQAWIADAVKRSEDYAKRDEKSGLLRYMLTSATQMVPIMVSGSKKAMQYGLTTGAAAAGTALVAGQLGPQVGIPEELVTVPGAAAFGFRYGATVGLAEDMYEIEAGHAAAEYMNLTDEDGKPIDPTLAKMAAVGVGVVNAGLEVAGFRYLSHSLPVNWLKSKLGTKMIGAALKDPGVKSALTELAKRYTTAVGGEAGTEMAQESANILGKWAAANMATLIDGQQFDERDIAIFTSENLSRVMDAGKQALAAASVLGAPGITMEVVSDQKRLRHQDMFRKGMDAINEAVQDSLTQGRSQETMRDFLQLSGNGGAAYLDSDRILQVPAEILAKVGITPAQAELSDTTGQNQRIRIEDAHTRLTRDEFKLLNEIMLPTSEAMVSPEDIARDVDRARQVSEEEVAKEKEFRVQLGDFRTQLAEAVKQLPNLRDQALAVNQTPAEYATTVSKLVERYARRMALEGRELTETLNNIKVRAFPGGAPKLGEIQQDLSPDAQSWLETLSDAERAALAPSIEHLKQFPDQQGDKANLQMVLELARDKELHQGAVRLDAPGKSLALVDLLRNWKKAHGDRSPTPGSKEWNELVKQADEIDAQRGLVLNQSETNAASMADTIDVDGVQRPTTNSNGKRIAQTEEQVRNFWRWFGDSKVVDEQGRPLVVYHGTTAEFDRFNKKKANPESDLGAGFYFTNEPEDVGVNYAGEGPDLTNKITQRAEQIANENDWEYNDERAYEMARKEFSSHGGAVLPVYLAIKNPVVIGDLGPTWLEATFNERTGKESGTLIKFAKNLRRAAKKYHDHDIDRAIGDALENGYEITAKDIIDILKKSEGLAYSTDDNGTLVSSEIIRQAFEYSGFDGFIDESVNEKFGSDRKTGRQMEGMDSGTTHFIAFKPTQIKSATGNRGTFDPSNPSILLQEQTKGDVPLASFKPDESLIKLFSGANLSSVLHELAHFFLEDMRTAIDSGVASESLKDDWAKLMVWMQKNGHDFTTDNRGAHEQFARAFEEYLMEGKAPDAELANVFSRLSHWLKRAYQTVLALGPDRVPLTDEVRGVFDRMLQADQEAAQAAESLSLSTISEKELTGLGMSMEEKERIRDTLDNAKRKTAELIERARNRGRKALEKEWRDEATKSILNDPTYQAMAHIKQAGGLRWVAVLDTYGPDTVKALDDKGLIASKNIDGAIPDVVASSFGFPDGEALVVALLDAHPNRKAAEDAYVAAQAREYDASFKAEEMALDAKEYRDYLDLMNKYLNAALGREDSIKTEAYRLVAEQQMLNYQMKDATHVGFQMATLRKLLKRERRAIMAGDFETALIANEQARLAFERARLAREAQKIRDSLIKRGNKTANAERGKIEEQHHLNIINVLQRYGLLKGNPERFAEWLKRREEIGTLFTSDDPLMSTEDLFGAWLMKDDHTQGWQTLTLGEFKELSNLVKYLNARGRALVDDEVRSLNATVSELHAKMLPRLQEQKTKPPIAEGSLFAKSWKWVREFFAATDQFLFVLRRADGFTNVGHNGVAGPAETYLYTPLAKAFSEKLKLSDEIQKRIKPHIDQLLTSMAKHGKVLLNAPIPPTEIMQQKGKRWTYESVVAAALNMGNDYNRQALLDGHGMEEADLLALTSILSAADWQAIQAVWNEVNRLWPAINEVHHRLNQFHQDKVQAKAFTVTTADGQVLELEGGYYPVKFDPELSDDVAKQTEAESLLEDTRAMFPKPSARKGFTKGRQGTGGKPLRLSLGVLGSHLDHVVQYITHAEVVRDLSRVMLNQVEKGKRNPLKAEIARTQGDEVAKQLQPALAYIARPEGEILDTISKFLERQRSLATAYLLGLNLRVASLQITGATTMLTDLGAPHYFKGVMHMMAHPIDAWQKMRELSPYMAKRAELVDRDIGHSLKQFTLDERSIKGVTLTMVRSVAYVFIWLADAMVAVPAWWGAYHKALAANGGNAEAAVTTADELIAASNPSARPMDLAHFQRSNKGLHRLFTMFSTFTFKYGNRQRTFYNAWRAGKIDTVEYARHVALEALIPPLMMQVGMSLLWGNDLDDDDWKKAGLAVFLYQIQGLPYARDVIGAVATRAANATMDDKQYVPDPTKSPVFAGLDTLLRASNAGIALAGDLDDDAKQEKAVWAFADLVSYRLGLPVPKLARNLLEGMRQWEEEDGTPFNIFVPNPDARER